MKPNRFKEPQRTPLQTAVFQVREQKQLIVSTWGSVEEARRLGRDGHVEPAQAVQELDMMRQSVLSLEE